MDKLCQVLRLKSRSEKESRSSHEHLCIYFKLEESENPLLEIFACGKSRAKLKIDFPWLPLKSSLNGKVVLSFALKSKCVTEAGKIDMEIYALPPI